MTLAAGGTQMGLMSSSMEAHAAEGRRWEEWWATFGGGVADGRRPVHRPHFWAYGDATGPMLIHGIAALDQNRSIQPETLETGPEIENFYYGRWNKSFRQTFAQMAVAHILGSTNLNISMYDFMGNRPDDEPERAVFLKQVRPNLDWLADRFPMTMQSVGVGVPWSQDMGRTIHTERGESWFELHCPSRGWAYWLGAAGDRVLGAGTGSRQRAGRAAGVERRRRDPEALAGIRPAAGRRRRGDPRRAAGWGSGSACVLATGSPRTMRFTRWRNVAIRPLRCGSGGRSALTPGATPADCSRPR